MFPLDVTNPQGERRVTGERNGSLTPGRAEAPYNALGYDLEFRVRYFCRLESAPRSFDDPSSPVGLKEASSFRSRGLALPSVQVVESSHFPDLRGGHSWSLAGEGAIRPATKRTTSDRT